MTQELANEIVNSSTRCTQATLRAFGFDGIPQTGSGVLEFLKENGFKFTRFREAEGKKMKNVQNLMKEGRFKITTHKHAMAVIDGILIDTAKCGWDSRVIEFAWVVESGND